MGVATHTPAKDENRETRAAFETLFSYDIMLNKLKQGDRFPTITLNLIGGDTIRFPDDVQTRYEVLLFYRGYW